MSENPYLYRMGFEMFAEEVSPIYFYIMLLKQVTKSNTLIKN